MKRLKQIDREIKELADAEIDQAYAELTLSILLAERRKLMGRIKRK